MEKDRFDQEALDKAVDKVLAYRPKKTAKSEKHGSAGPRSRPKQRRKKK